MGEKIDLLQGTLDLLVLKTLLFGPLHGHGIARQIQRVSDDVLRVDHGSLYPALHRLEGKGWIASRWGPNEQGRDRKFYRLTAAGKKQLAAEESRWQRMVDAIATVLKGAGREDLA